MTLLGPTFTPCCAGIKLYVLLEFSMFLIKKKIRYLTPLNPVINKILDKI